ncbi:hypothetical protein GE300_22450 [Rhodobacteraceae bacterium 2CG4]|uniref:DUF4148 domain-containing protein n=1 Tax=Halovulum marinum TaxID=2662447 RepID=A0A6L5Z872_9RHOB|nr:hypothetical protein [Halovulum marinum]MSU92294.1 hypothetical protein [Halovulum marinum]
MKKLALAALAAAALAAPALAAPVAAQSALDAQVAQYVSNPEALTIAQKATVKGLTEGDYSRSELQSRIDAVVN